MPVRVVVPDRVVQVSIALETSDNVYTGSGGFAIGGSAEVTRALVYPASGGVQIGGSAEVSRDREVTGVGGVSIGGAADCFVTHAGGTVNYGATGTGGVQIGGSADFSVTQGQTTIAVSGTNVAYTFQALGGVAIGGNAVVSFQSGNTGIGSVGENQDYTFQASGGVLIDGEATVDFSSQIVIITENLPQAYVGIPYGVQLMAQIPCDWAHVGGVLPSGFEFTLGGVLQGVADGATQSLVTLVFQASAPGYATATKIVTLFVGYPTLSEELVMLSFAMPSGFVGVNYLLQLNAAGAQGTVVWSYTGQLPTGMGLTPGGLLYGAPTAGGIFLFTIFATDGVTTVSTDVSIYIGSNSQLVILTQSPLPVAVEGQIYPTVQFEVAGLTSGAEPPVWDVILGNTPPGLSLSLSGAFGGQASPGVSGTYIFTARASRPPDLSASKEFTVVVNALSHYNYTPTGSGLFISGFAPVSQGHSVVGSGGVLISGSATCLFTPAAGTHAFTYNATGGVQIGGSATSSFSPALTGVAAQVTLADGTVITVTPGQNYLYTTGLTAGSIVAPRGCPGVQIYMIVDGDFIFFGLRNTGRNYGGTPYGGVPQPVYISDVVANMPGRLVPYGALFRSVRQNGSLFTLIHHDDPKHPMFAQANDPIAYGSKATATTPATGSHAFHMLNGGMEMQWCFVLESDPIEKSREPSQATIDDALEVVGLDTAMIATYPNCAHTVDNFERDPSQDNTPTLPRPQTKEGWLMFPENVAYLGGGSPAFQGAGKEKMKCWHHGMSVFTLGTKINTNGHYWEPAWWILNYLRHPATKYECLAIGLGINRQEIACGMFRCDVTYTVKDWYVPEGTQLIGPPGSNPSYPEGDPNSVLYCRGTDAGWAFPSLAKQYDLPRVLVKIVRPDDVVNNDCFARRSSFWVNFPVNTHFGINNNNKLLSDGQRVVAHVLYNMMWFYRYYKLYAGDLTTANLIKAKANQLIENLYLLTQAAVPVNPKPKWLPRTNNPTVTPWSGVEAFAMSGVGEGVYHAMAKWIFDEGTNANRQVWFKELVEWALQNTLEMVTPTRVRFAYVWQPDTSGPANWNNPPQIHTGTEQNAHILQLLPFILEWWPGVLWTVPGMGQVTTENLCQYLINDIWNGTYTIANTGAISTGPNNYSSTPKFNRIKAHSTVLKKGL